jgi:hypothetical protein
MHALAIVICAVEGEIFKCLADDMDEDCDVVRRLVRLRAELRSLWLPGGHYKDQPPTLAQVFAAFPIDDHDPEWRCP